MGKIAKLLVTLSALGVVSTSYAQEMPAENTGYAFGYLHGLSLTAGGLYNRFGNNGTSFGGISLRSVDGTVIRAQSTNLDPDYQWGYHVGMGFFIDCTDTQLNIDYSLLNTKSSGEVISDNFDFGLLGQSVDANNSYSSLTLTLGHLSRYWPFFDFLFYFGVDFLHYSNNSTRLDITDPPSFPSTLRLSYNGVGPTFGLSSNFYPFCEVPGFSIFGQVQTSFTYGQSHRSEVSRFDAGTEILTTFTRNGTLKNVMPAFTGRLALAYNHLVGGGMAMKLTAGFQGIYLYRVVSGNDTVTTAGLSSASLSGLYFDFTFQL